MKRLFACLNLALLVVSIGIPLAAHAECGSRETVRTYNTANGDCREEKAECDGKTVVTSCCLCTETGSDSGQFGGGRLVTTQVMRGSNGYTYSSCQALCKQTNGVVNRQVGAGALPPDVTAPTLAEVQQNAKYCFSASDCASEEYGGSLQAFRAGYGCPSGQGRCVAPEPQVALSFPIGNIKTVAGLRGFISTAFNYATGIAAVAAAVMFVWGGMRYIFGSAFQNIKRAKEIMVDAAVGLVLTLGAMVILRAVNPTTLDLNALQVFMINKEQLLNEEFCTDITDAQGKKDAADLLFADAGPAPVFTPIGQVRDTDYSVKQSETKCNYQYYVKGFGENRCKGQVCDQLGTACVSCKTGLCEGGDLASYGCIKSSISGSVGHDDDRYLDSIRLYAICTAALSLGGADDITGAVAPFVDNKVIVPVAEGRILGQTAGVGKQGYVFNITGTDIKKATDECGGAGNIHGFVLGIEYNDVGGAGGAVGKILTGTNLEPTNDDFAVVGPSNCGSSGKFPAYVDGKESLSEVENGYAVACGVMTGSKPLAEGSNVWGLVRMNKTFGFGGDEPLTCNFDLNTTNAASNMAANGSANKVTFDPTPLKTYTCGTN